jgi:uncharacterized membrane protein
MIRGLLLIALIAISCCLLLIPAAVPLLVKFGLLNTASAINVFFADACNQDPSRTIWYLGYPMAICGRCVGSYLGTLLAGYLLIKNISGSTTNAISLLLIGLSDKIFPTLFSSLEYQQFVYSTVDVTTTGRILLGIFLGLGLVFSANIICSKLSFINPFYCRSGVPQ